VEFKAGKGFEDFHLTWETIWRLIAPGFLPYYSPDFPNLIVPNVKEFKSNLKKEDFGKFDQLKTICSPDRSNFESLDGWTQEQIIASKVSFNSTDILKSFIIDKKVDDKSKMSQTEDKKPQQLVSQILDEREEITTTNTNNFIATNINSPTSEQWSILYQMKFSWNTQYLNSKDVTNLRPFLGLEISKTILKGSSKRMFIVIAWRKTAKKPEETQTDKIIAENQQKETQTAKEEKKKQTQTEKKKQTQTEKKKQTQTEKKNQTTEEQPTEEETQQSQTDKIIAANQQKDVADKVIVCDQKRLSEMYGPTFNELPWFLPFANK